MKWITGVIAIATFLVTVGVIAVPNPLRDALVELIAALTELIRATTG
ncbi:hypothetical protein LCGC14_0918590 [marine sediment metagenome]|uniref:Uncharacterized protein n=1 Tax=marine sediment metagenome TaxID=412755 RepID=A0A0F9RA59_9ZZZZ